MRTAGDPAAVRDKAREVVAGMPGVKVTDIGEARQVIGSSLTAVDLSGLTRLELGYAFVLVACAAGLVLALGGLDRRRSFAILSALGAKPRQLRAFLWSEGIVMLATGGLAGLLAGGGLAAMLVSLLTGVFDPPPDSLSVPWGYLWLLLVSAGAAVSVAVVLTARYLMKSVVARLRETS